MSNRHPTTNRREFLGDSLLAAASAWAARSATPRAFADTGSSSPNERIRVAVIGVNGQGKGHLGAYSRRKDAEVAIVCDVDEQVGRDRAGKVQNATGTVPTYIQDLRRVFDDKTINAVSIATPNHWHALAAIWAMQAGKDVYVEKPVSHNVQEGRSMVACARTHQRICQTGTQIRSSEGIRQAMEFLHAGKLGDIQIARGLCYKRRDSIGKTEGPQPIPAHVDYNLWQGPAPERPLRRKRLHYDWHWIWDYGNGDLGNQGIHQMDLARWALGVDHLADEVLTLGGRLGYVDDGETPNTEITFFKYGDQQLIFETRGLPTEKYKGAGVGDVIHCANGYLVIPSYSAAIAYDLDGKVIQKFEAGGDHFANFLGAVRSRKHADLHADILEGHLSSALCHLGNISYRLGAPETLADCRKALQGHDAALETLDRTAHHLTAAGVNLDATRLQLGARLAFDPKTEKFVDDSRADQHLTREYRAPFVVPTPANV